MNLNNIIQLCNEYVWGWPSIIFVIAVGLFCSIAFNFIQIRTFFSMWKETFAPSGEKHTGEISPLQAFINTLSSNLGNGSLAGVAVAISTGGPGAVFWLCVMGVILMAIRFAEVYLSVLFPPDSKARVVLGGPMVYLKRVPMGAYLAPLYGWLCFGFGLIGGNGSQSNSIRLSLETTWHISALAAAIGLTIFVAYVVLGGAKRIAHISDMIVPVKVLVFFAATGVIVVYNGAHIMQAISFIIQSGMNGTAAAGGLIGFSVQQAIRSGMLSITFATESGLGTSAILFGSAGGSDAKRSALMAMLSTFISTLVSFLVGLCIVVTGVWSSGLSSTALTIASFNTVFGAYGGWIVTFLSVIFGVGVIVSYAYITRAAWLYLMRGRYQGIFALLYCVATFAFALINVDIVWNIINIVMAVMLFINLFGVLWLTPYVARALKAKK